MPLAISLAILVPYALLWSNNWHMFSPEQLLFSAAMLLCFTIIIFFSTSIFLYYATNIWLVKNKKVVSVVIHFIYAVIFSYILSLLLRLHYQYYIYPEYTSILIIILGTIIVFFLKMVRFVNIFLTIMLCLCLSSTVFSLITAPPEDFGFKTKKSLPNGGVTFNNRPNVYLFILESFHDFPMMENVYGIDTHTFKNFLDLNNFVTYKDVYSNSPYTLLSLCDLFTLKKCQTLLRGQGDIDLIGRYIIGGSEDNIVFNTFKKNGYYIENIWLKNQDYYLVKKFVNLDKVDLPSTSIFHHLVAPILLINNDLTRAAYKMQWQLNKDHIEDPAFKYALENSVTAAMAARPKNAPYFLTVKTGADHAHRGYTWKPDDDWGKSGIYQSLVQDSMAQLQSVLIHIINQDPEALIILLGDHGAHRYQRFIPSPFTSDTEFDQQCAKFHLSRKDIARDSFGVLLAVRMPSGKQDIAQGYILSQRNLFLNIFSALADDPTLMQWRQASVSQNEDGLIIVKEGKVQDRWLPSSQPAQDT